MPQGLLKDTWKFRVLNFNKKNHAKMLVPPRILLNHSLSEDGLKKSDSREITNWTRSRALSTYFWPFWAPIFPFAACASCIDRSEGLAIQHLAPTSTAQSSPHSQCLTLHHHVLFYFFIFDFVKKIRITAHLRMLSNIIVPLIFKL